jgi:hypothetical protein
MAIAETISDARATASGTSTAYHRYAEDPQEIHFSAVFIFRNSDRTKWSRLWQAQMSKIPSITQTGTPRILKSSSGMPVMCVSGSGIKLRNGVGYVGWLRACRGSILICS